MNGQIEKLHDDCDVEGVASTPHNDNLFKIDEKAEKLNAVKANYFYSNLIFLV